MANDELKQILIKGAAELGVKLSTDETAAFFTYLRELREWNQKINLTAIENDREIIIKHFIDSLSIAPFVSGCGSLFDIGSGAGFPGIPLKIIMPGLKVTLIDAVNKKVLFIRHMARTLGLKDIQAVQGRVEDRQILDKFSNQFDVVVSRAFAGLSEYLKKAVPFVKSNGTLLAIKGPKWADELEAAKEIRGIAYLQSEEFTLPFSGSTTAILVFKKE